MTHPPALLSALTLSYSDPSPGVCLVCSPSNGRSHHAGSSASVLLFVSISSPVTQAPPHGKQRNQLEPSFLPPALELTGQLEHLFLTYLQCVCVSKASLPLTLSEPIDAPRILSTLPSAWIPRVFTDLSPQSGVLNLVHHLTSPLHLKELSEFSHPSVDFQVLLCVPPNGT